MDFLVTQLFNLMGFLGAPLFWGIVGLLVGWNLLPQPAVVKKAWDFVVSKFQDE